MIQVEIVVPATRIKRMSNLISFPGMSGPKHKLSVRRILSQPRPYIKVFGVTYDFDTMISSSWTSPLRMEKARTGCGASGSKEMMKYAWFG
jgi:hypothetical protein